MVIYVNGSGVTSLIIEINVINIDDNYNMREILERCYDDCDDVSDDVILRKLVCANSGSVLTPI